MLVLLLICHFIAFLLLLSYFLKEFNDKLSAILLANLFGFLLSVPTVVIIVALFARDVTTTTMQPLKPNVQLVTATQVLKPGNYVKSIDTNGYLTTGDATKAVTIKMKGDGDTIKDITYTEEHTDKKWFWLTLQKDSEKPKNIATITTKESTKTLKHFFD